MNSSPIEDKHTDPEFLKNEAYKEASDLETRLKIQDEYSRGPENWFSWAFERMAFPPRSRLLELGCGPGDLWEENSRRLPDWQIILSDLSEGMVKEAREKLATRQHHFQYSVLEAGELPFRRESFDGVIAFGLLDHVPDMAAALNEITRLLIPEGTLYASAGGTRHLQELEVLVSTFLPNVSYGGAAERFGLENGIQLLSPWFTEVDLFPYEDELVFDQAGPLVAYALSEASVRQSLSGEQMAAFVHQVKSHIVNHGPVRAQIHKGIFIARK